MKRRAFVVALAFLGLAPRARAQDGATRTQIDLALASASLAALLTRYGESYPDVVSARARVAALGSALREARARGEVVDVAQVTSRLDAELADVRARLTEQSSRCAGRPEMDGARARELALADAVAHVTSEGFFLP